MKIIQTIASTAIFGLIVFATLLCLVGGIA